MVRRAPCSHGRVSPANTRAMRPHATPARITPSAVPKPAVASEPVLQWVSTPTPVPDQRRAQFAHAPVGGEILVLDRLRLARQRRRIARRRRRTRCMRSSAHIRLTAVGRAARKRRERRVEMRADRCRAASTTPHAAAMPIAGAPRTTRSRIAAATSSALRQSRGFLERQAALVEQAQAIALPEHGADGVVGGRGLQGHAQEVERRTRRRPSGQFYRDRLQRRQPRRLPLCINQGIAAEALSSNMT